MSNAMRQATATGRQRPNDSQRNRTALIAGVLLFGLVLGMFLPALSNGFVGFDDPDYVTENGHVQAGLTWESVLWAFRSTEAANWHPVTWLSHMLDCELFGLAPWGHHLTSILLHAVNATLLFWVLRHMTGATWRSLVVALLFGVHPLRVESVAWIAERKDVLSTTFWLLTLWAYARYAEVQSPKSKVQSPKSKVQSPKSKVQSPPTASNNVIPSSRITHHASRFYLLSLIFFVLGLMSKPMLVTLPCVLLLLDYWPLGRLRLVSARGLIRRSGTPSPRADEGTSANPLTPSLSPSDGERVPARAGEGSPTIPVGFHWSGWVRLLAEKLPFFLAAAAVSGVTFLVQQRGGAMAGGLPLTDRAANAVVSYCRYLGNLFWPVNLAAFYPRVDHWPTAVVAAAGLLLLVITVAVIALRRGHPYAMTGWLWFLGTLVPVIGLVQVGGQSMADRYSYVPSIGVFLVLVWGAHKLSCGWRYQAAGAAAVSAATVLLCAGLTWRQISYWKDGESLFRHAILVTKDNYNAHHALGMALDRQERVDEAISEYREALREKSDYAEAYNNLGVDLAQQGHVSEGMNQFLAALRFKPGYADPHNNIGTTLEKQGRFDEALEQFQVAARLRPDFADAHYNLGIALGRKGRTDEAAAQFLRVLELRPNYAEAHNNLGVMLDRKGQVDEAAREYAEAARLKPNYASARYNLGVALARQGHLAEAIAEFRETLRLKPDYTAAQSNLAAALAVMQNGQNKQGGAKQP
jgi:Flp pilus assembly protein TadD